MTTQQTNAILWTWQADQTGQVTLNILLLVTERTFCLLLLQWLGDACLAVRAGGSSCHVY